MPPCRAIAIAVATTFGVLSVGWTQFALEPRTPSPVSEFAAPLTAEQFEVGNEFLDALGWMFWEMADGIFVAEEPEEMINLDQSELNEIVEGNFEEFRPRIKAQLLFLRKTSHLSDEQFQTISDCGEYEVKESLRKYFAEVMRSDSFEGRGDVESVESKPLHQLIQETLADFVKTQMSADQTRQYDQELAARVAHRKRVTILNLVARLDADLLLLPEQRDQFTKLIDSEWQDAWGQSLGALMPDANYMPALPDDKVLPILKDCQRVVWQGLHYNRESAGWDDDPIGLLEEDEEAEAVDVEPKEDEPVKLLAIPD